jgi:alkyl hydroperoxide reductase subunit AhpC
VVENTMTLLLGDTVPDFTQDSQLGPINLYDFAGDSWVVLFSHPADFTPVCTTELGEVAKLRSEWDKRNVKTLALSVDTAESHKGWIPDINETQGTKVNWKDGQDVVVVPSISIEDARAKFPKGVTEIKPYLRTTPQPNR